jgi:DNA-binding response OmpR family regulator
VKVACPGCGTPYALDDALAGQLVLCGNCQTAFRLAESPRADGGDGAAKARAPAAAAAAPEAVADEGSGPWLAVPEPTAPAPRVLLAHENARVCEVTSEVLREAGFVPLVARGGARAKEVLAAGAADALVADVALPEVPASQLCDWLRGQTDEKLSRLPVVLVASVFRHTAYKRRPARLYGADDYVEQHHIPDMLVPKIARLLQARGMEVPGGSLVEILGSGDPAHVDALATEERKLFEASAEKTGAALEAAERRARRLAWILVADVILYNEPELERQAPGAPPSARLAADVAEGRRLFDKLVPDALRARADWFGQAFDEYLSLRGTPA